MYEIEKHWFMFEIEMQQKINKLAGRYSFPEERDLGDAIEGILRLHYMYDLDLDKVIK